MWIKDTPENRSLAAIVERNAKASTGLNLAKRAFWHGGGFALRVAGAGLGAGVMLAGLGYGVNQAGEGYDRVVGNAKRLYEQQDFQARMTQEQEQAEQKERKDVRGLDVARTRGIFRQARRDDHSRHGNGQRWPFGRPACHGIGHGRFAAGHDNSS